MTVPPSPSLIEAIAAHYALTLGSFTRLAGGEEAVVWRAESSQGPVAVMEYPTWRTLQELWWVHGLVAAAHRTVPEAVAPLAAADGSTLLLHKGHPIALFPFVNGVPLDAEDRALRLDAARLLARIHGALLAVPITEPRPASTVDAPWHWQRPPDPPELIDHDLDDLIARVRRGERRCLSGPIHGDYYSRNVLCRDGRVAGVIDWSEAHQDWLIQELAWSTWEFAHNDAGDDLLRDRAREFLQAYMGAGGRVPESEHDLIIAFIRLRLRAEIRLYLAARLRGLGWGSEYADAETRAFKALGGQQSAL